MHPDNAWTPWYIAPAGIPDEPCCHIATRESVGPTSRRRNFMILVDCCRNCGRNLRTINEVSWREYDWLRRWNKSLDFKAKV